jgi:hypothetical protein
MTRRITINVLAALSLLLVAALPATSQAAGKLVFDWPGADYWGVYAGDTLVDHRLGGGTMTLRAGTYVVKSTHREQPFRAFRVTIYDGRTTTVTKGGVLDFQWPGHESTCIYRGSTLVDCLMGSFQQALEQGRYLIKPDSRDNHIAPTYIDIERGYVLTVRP